MADAAPVEIPIPQGAPLFSIRTTLDGVEYIFQFDWNDRENRWYFSIQDITETTLAGGIKIVSNIDLLRYRREQTPTLPPGVLMAADLSNPVGEPPEYNDLGNRVRVFYFPTIPTT